MDTTRRSHVSREAVARAVDSLLKWIRAHQNPKKNVAGGGDRIYLVLTLTKAPHKSQSKVYSIPLPHPLHDPSTVSLVVDDGPDSPLNLPAARGRVRSLNLPVSQILSLPDLRSGVLPDWELLFTDRRLAPSLLRFLQKYRSQMKDKKKKKKIDRRAVALNLSCDSWPEHLRRVCCSTVLNLGPGTCSGIKIGTASLGRDKVLDNVMGAVDGAVRNVPRKWSNVMAFHLKTSESLALPIYQKNDLMKVVTDIDDEHLYADSEENDEEMEAEQPRRNVKKVKEVVGKRRRDERQLSAEKKRLR
ncbi:hypothetical protein AXF42_Ash009371 [Apostasia shenzhenica]|uniref:Ribosomal L1 domain-containing protein 1 n=1 Tax=Apostasia shenzhenica TaxID=1088818 RepID=A0A2I0B3W1_9ASPA|nr:hypothetical protein AXF42_Ash009371 [Apostasia shenzhenica]